MPRIKEVLAPIVAYLQRRLAEPESRAAVGVAATAAAAWASGQITIGQLGLGEFGALVTFALPAPIAREIIVAIGAAGKRPAA